MAVVSLGVVALVYGGSESVTVRDGWGDSTIGGGVRAMVVVSLGVVASVYGGSVSVTVRDGFRVEGG